MFRVGRMLALPLMALLLASCAGLPLLGERKPVVRSIAILPALSPATYEVENRDVTAGGLFSLTALAYRAEGIEKSRLLTRALVASNYSLGEEFTRAVAQALQDQGYQVEVLRPVRAGQDDAADVDYGNLSYSADALLHVFVSEAGLYSPSPSGGYVPRVNAGGRVFIKGRQSVVYDQTLFYGADARDGVSWGIVADERYVFQDLDVVLAHPEMVRPAFAEGARALAKRMGTQIHAALN